MAGAGSQSCGRSGESGSYGGIGWAVPRLSWNTAIKSDRLLGLAMHWLPGFYNGRGIDPQRFTPDAVPFSMYLNQDKPLIGFWLLLACPWIVARRSLRLTICVAALALTLTVIAALGGAVLLGVTSWAPKWPEQAWIWVLNNLLLVTLVEEALFRGYVQGGLSQRFKQLPYGENLALLLASLLFELVHLGAGWQWTLLAGVAGVGYGLAYRFGGLGAAVAPGVRIVVASPNFPENAYRGRKETGRAVLFT
ncbi:CPBP family intramembrane glutamic endopeptidase [Pseudomonas helleri]|uniref:CPBP family intramembrane glutamic endopeptidase n=1 Tax=Pseudomonas helleri TaxID=1608996 RepID=UPI001E32845C|nr:CPBP family intramembrane glutamic endopeptidase [Pseudomonas helleri]